MRGCLFSDADVRLLAQLFSPEYIWEAAIEHGGGNAVVGAAAAYSEARSMARGYVRHVLARAKRAGADRELVRKDAQFIFGVMRMGERVQELKPLESGYRRLMVDAWPQFTAWSMVGETPPIEVGPAGHTAIRLAVLRATAAMLEANPDLNRALLPPFGPGAQVWQRTSAEVVVPLELRQDDLSVVVVEPQSGPGALVHHMQDRFRKLLRVRKHRLAHVGDTLLRAWLRRGFLASYGGAFVSDAGAYPIGKAYPILIPGNGIPLSIAINPAREGKVILGITVDHRVFDASHGAKMHAWFAEQLPRFVEETS